MNDRQPAAIDDAGPNGWCRCEKPEDTYAERTNLYSKYFIPDGWALRYEVLTQPGTE